MTLNDRFPPDAPVVIVGAGPAGLTAAYELTRIEVPVLVFEQDSQVGGIARTVEYKGFRFDIGGHRFFTKVQIVRDLWRSTLGSDFLRRPRLSRIYYRGRFFDYPLKPFNALSNLGILTSTLVLLSYLWIKLFPIKPEVSLEDWVSNRFGRRLYRIFFKTYTEKVWGIPCHTIGAQWAAQRIKGLSLRTALVNMLFPRRSTRRGDTIKTLIDEFEYPRHGPGMMWDVFRRKVESAGGLVELDTAVIRLHHDGPHVTAVKIARNGAERLQATTHVISTMPIRHLVRALEPPAPPDVIAAADRLKYRDFVTVALIIDEESLFPDNWIYVHDDAVKVGRIQNFKNWSPDMVPDPRQTCLGLEYFCFEGDGLWSMRDADLIDLATRELTAIGLARPDKVIDGTVVRMPKAYPVYDEGYDEALDVVRRYLARFENLQLVGRNGMHKYNNQDHSMLTAILAVRNLFGERHDLWAVNADEEYHEEASDDDATTPAGFAADLRELARTQPAVPVRLPARNQTLKSG
ncbi:MAG: NAD(P)/FAD-dependent oxidoreductase [Acidobacteria bacterium]|nr:NAD(P)/FAD-dependent oxidoreductase [Acidobacteriota bacterium]